MDPVNLAFYAIVCGALAAYAPNAGGRPMRAVLGIAVGLVAATVLPVVKSALGI